MSIHASIHAHHRFLIATDAAALLLVELILFALSRIRYVMSPLAFHLLGIAVVLGFAADVGLWFWNGIRAVDLNDDVLTVYRGRSLAPQAFPRGTVRQVKLSRLSGGRSVRLRTLSGRRVRIVENAFPREEFNRLLTALEMWAPR
jgi:hypothetical protein